MKVGDLVRVRDHGGPLGHGDDTDWIGIITDFKRGYAVVFWNEKYPCEEEYLEQIEVISESR